MLDGELPDPETPAPPRFLPAFDNVVLGFDDRSRVIDDAHRRLSVEGARFVLVDGRVAGTWRPAQEDLQVTLFGPDGADAVEEEGDQLRAWHGLEGRTVVEIRR
ncbi:DNA glycosylase AlkZ-like family protein [Paractinoplanes lichenicola]|uniref:DNA glycosylase AlkZ-like family protein n=1 Tax=Paractinoplanes lichenicola TaxID=2802976 RepID=UPI0027DCB4B0|nr:crosslink repair DNA glycosylase YcaQ family protein [Actinoplanes lichenicola]